jgi:uncharacterized peroxidase-related enzyme
VHHGAALRALSKDDLAQRIEADPDGAEVAARLRAILDYALLLTREPAAVGSEQVDRLRSAGLTEEEIHRVVLVVAYFSFVNRVAEGLGIELESPGGEAP